MNARQAPVLGSWSADRRQVAAGRVEVGLEDGHDLHRHRAVAQAAGHPEQERLVGHRQLVAPGRGDLAGGQRGEAVAQGVEQRAEVEQLLDLGAVEDQDVHGRARRYGRDCDGERRDPCGLRRRAS